MLSDIIKERIAYAQSSPKDITLRPNVNELSAMFQRFNLHQFIGAYFSADFRQPINDLLEQIELGTTENYAFWHDHEESPQTCVFESFSTQDITQKTRDKDSSPYSRETVQKLQNTLDQYPHVALTMIAIQKGIGAFFLDVEKSYLNDRGTIPLHLDRFLNNSVVLNSFLGELLPNILISLAQQPDIKSQEFHYNSGLKESFSRSVWKTSHERRVGHSQGKGVTTIICPFSRFIDDLWRTVYKEGANRILVPTGEKRDGAFPAMVTQRIEQLEKKSPLLKPLPF